MTGWMWFLAGLATPVALVALAELVLWRFAMKAEAEADETYRW